MQSFFAINRLSAYIDGELPDSEAAQVERAIAANPAVREEYERMLSTIELLRTRGPVQAPPSLHASILARVADEPDPVVGLWARLWAPFQALPMEAVGVVFAVVAVVILINQEPGLEPPPPETLAYPMAAERMERERSLETETPQKPPELAARPDQPAPSAPEAGLPPKPMGTSAARSTTPSDTTKKGANEQGRPVSSKKSVAKEVESKNPKVIPPKQAYEAEWEQQGKDQSSSFGGNDTLLSQLQNQPYYYRLDPSDQHGLESLQRLAAKFGGSLKYADGRPFQSRILQDGDLMELQADIPSDRVTAFTEALKQLGMVVPMQSDGAQLYAEMTQVRVQVRFNAERR